MEELHNAPGLGVQIIAAGICLSPVFELTEKTIEENL